MLTHLKKLRKIVFVLICFSYSHVSGRYIALNQITPVDDSYISTESSKAINHSQYHDIHHIHRRHASGLAKSKFPCRKLTPREKDLALRACTMAGKFPLKNECRVYLRCSKSGVPASKQCCPAGLHFDHKRRRCITKKDAVCNNKPRVLLQSNADEDYDDDYSDSSGSESEEYNPNDDYVDTQLPPSSSVGLPPLPIVLVPWTRVLFNGIVVPAYVPVSVPYSSLNQVLAGAQLNMGLIGNGNAMVPQAAQYQQYPPNAPLFNMGFIGNGNTMLPGQNAQMSANRPVMNTSPPFGNNNLITNAQYKPGPPNSRNPSSISVPLAPAKPYLSTGNKEVYKNKNISLNVKPILPKPSLQMASPTKAPVHKGNGSNLNHPALLPSTQKATDNAKVDLLDSPIFDESIHIIQGPFNSSSSEGNNNNGENELSTNSTPFVPPTKNPVKIIPKPGKMSKEPPPQPIGVPTNSQFGEEDNSVESVAAKAISQAIASITDDKVTETKTVKTSVVGKRSNEDLSSETKDVHRLEGNDTDSEENEKRISVIESIDYNAPINPSSDKNISAEEHSQFKGGVEEMDWVPDFDDNSDGGDPVKSGIIVLPDVSDQDQLRRRRHLKKRKRKRNTNTTTTNHISPE